VPTITLAEKLETLGIKTAWVNRRQGKPSAATKLVAAEPDIEVPTVGALASRLAS
jgi:hypothetical protein